MFAHIYCPDLLVQCERLFRPELRSQALIIYEPITHQGNDHIRLVACSSQARELGFEMSLGSEKLGLLIEQLSGDEGHRALFQCQPNRELYADMSERLFSSLEILAPSVTPIASDEAFLDLTNFKRLTYLTQNQQKPTEQLAHETAEQLQDFAYELRHSVKQWLSLDIIVGIGTTKTLAYLGCSAARREYEQAPKVRPLDKQAENRRTTVLTASESSQPVLAEFPVSEMRGIGSKALSKLSELGIHSALELSQASSQLIGKRCSVLVEHIAIELAGLTSQITSEQFSSKRLSPQPLSSQQGVPSAIRTKPSNQLTSCEIEKHLQGYTKACLQAQVKGHYKNGVLGPLIRIALEMLINAHHELVSRQLNCHNIHIALERSDLHAQDETFIDHKSIELPEPSGTLGPIKKLCRHILESMVSDDAHYCSLTLTFKCQNQDKAKQVGLFESIDEFEEVIAQLDENHPQFTQIQRYCQLSNLMNDKISTNIHRRLPKSPSYTSQWHELLRVN